MLPDYPKLKKKISDIYNARINSIISHIPFDGVSKHTAFEGRKNKIIRQDGTVDETEFKEIASNISIDLKDYENITLSDILKKIDECAAKMAKQESLHFIEVIDKAVESAGNTVNCVGESLAPKHIFEALEKMEISFNKDNTPNLPTFIASPNMSEKFKEMLKVIENTPELKEKMDTIIEKKRSEWRDREDSRKLVG